MRRLVGSNQYKTRWGADLPAPSRTGDWLTLAEVPTDPPQALEHQDWAPDLDPLAEPPARMWRLRQLQHLQLRTGTAGDRLCWAQVQGPKNQAVLRPVLDWDRGPRPAPGTSIYLSGPMSGHEDNNVPMFIACAQQLRHEGYRVVSPPEEARDKLNLNPASRTALDPQMYLELLEVDLQALETADWVLFLGPAPWSSRGTRMEMRWAIHQVPLGRPPRQLAHWVGCPGSG
jgi:hypothetical protein